MMTATRWRRYLRLRKGWALSVPTIPAELKDHIDSETFDKTRRYNLAKNTFGYVSDTVSTVQSVVTLLFLQPLIWEAAAHAVDSALVERLGLIGAESSTALAYAQIVAFLIMGSVVDLPLSLLCKIYSTFIIVRAPKLPSVSPHPPPPPPPPPQAPTTCCLYHRKRSSASTSTRGGRSSAMRSSPSS